MNESQVNRESVLSEAAQAVTKDRNNHYGDPEDNFADIARLWNAYKPGCDFDRLDVAMMMVMVKVARAYTSPILKDHWVDLAGYAACAYGCALKDEE